MQGFDPVQDWKSLKREGRNKMLSELKLMDLCTAHQR